MFDPAKDLHANPALFACYILYVYFRGRNAVRIEREMRELGYTTFHRRNLYPRGKQPGWIKRYGWQHLSVPPAVAGGSTQPIDPSGQPPKSTNVSQEGRFTPALRSTKSSGGKPAFPTEIGSDIRSNQPTEIPHSEIRNPHSNDFHSWLKRVSPNMTWDWKHQQVIIDQLKKVTEGECKRLMIFLPPRHGKSELVSVRYTAWRMQQDPSMNVILGSYNQRLADRMSRKIRTVVCDAEAIRLGASSVPPAMNLKPQINANERRSHKAIKAEEGIGVHLRPSAVNSPENGSPFPFSRPRPKNAVSEWETASGGSFRAVGSGSGVTGFGANLIVIDDPVKNRAQAESETFRNRVWDWYKDDLYTRLEPDGSIVLIQTRWHEDDLAGRLLRENLDDWTIINLPALSEPTASAGAVLSEPPASAGELTRPIDTPSGNASVNERGDRAAEDETTIRVLSCDLVDKNEEETTNQHEPTRNNTNSEIPHSEFRTPHSFDWRKPGEALCPERFDIDALDKLKTQLGTYSFSALYQQRPTPAGGQIFKREWFKQIIDFAPPGLKWTRGYDLAVSTSTESDYTASFRCAFDKQGNLYISGGFRRRIEFPEQRRYIIDRITNERDTQHGVELALHGQALLQDLRRDPALRGRSLRGVKVSTDKLTRALTWSPIAEEGKVILVRSSVPPAVAGGALLPKPATGRKATVKERGYEPCDTEIRNSPPYEGGVDAALGGRGGSLSCETEISPMTTERPVRNSPQRLRVSAVKHADWISELLDELTAFPNGTHDDQIDAISIAVQMHSVKPRTGGGLLIT